MKVTAIKLPGNYIYNQEKSNKLPFEQIKDFCKEISYKPIDRRKQEFECFVEGLKHQMKDKWSLSKEEFGMMQILQKFDINKDESEKTESSKLYACSGNMFTACLLFDKYVPYAIIKNYTKEFEFLDGDRMVSDQLLKADPSQIKPKEELSKMTRAEREEYYAKDKTQKTVFESPDVVENSEEYKNQVHEFNDCLGRWGKTVSEEEKKDETPEKLEEFKKEVETAE